MEADLFKCRHRKADRDFSRERSLPFSRVVTMILRKSVKPLQSMVNEAMEAAQASPVSASAYSQARHKLSHTAFIELNQKAIVEVMYGDDTYQTFWGYRLLAVDGSKIRLPDTGEMCAAFGSHRYSVKDKQTDTVIEGKHAMGLTSVLYDVLNRVAVDAVLARGDAYEVALAISHLPHSHVGDLWVLDRGYAAYRLLAELSKQSREFVIRCSCAAFSTARKMLKGEGSDSQVVVLKPPHGKSKALRGLGLPKAIKVRFVRVRLSTGEQEVLVTSLLDEQRHPTEAFRELYGLRWGIETFYGLLKTRLELENFSGISVEAVKQDFYATLYLTGMESILTADAQKVLDGRPTQSPQKVNRGSAFNIIKHQAFNLLNSRIDDEQLLERITKLFLQSPNTDRKGRNPPRKASSAHRLLNFHKRQKKHCF